MRFTLPLLLLTAGPSFADTFHTAPRAVAATLYANVAEVTHQIALSLPAGTHDVLFPFEFGRNDSVPRIRSLTEGVTISQVKLQEGGLLDQDLYRTPEQSAAQAAVDAAQDALSAHEQTINELSGRMRALEAQLAFLRSLSAGDVTLAASDILTVSSNVLSETETALAEIAKQSVLIEQENDRTAELASDLQKAQAKLARLLPPKAGQKLWSVRVTSAAETEALIEMVTQADGAYWQPVYDIHLNSDTPNVLSLHRKAGIVTSDAVSWQGIDLTLSTADPNGQSGPSHVSGRHAYVFEEEQIKLNRSEVARYSADAVSEEEIIVVEEAAFGVDYGEFDVTYNYSQPVDIGPSDTLILDFGQLELPVETQIHAAARYDNTAYLVASLTNDSGAPLLGGMASCYRDGVLIAQNELSPIATSETSELPFGPVEHIRLTYAEKDDQTGERGFIKSATSRTHEALVRVENLGNTAEDVRVFFPTTYSEQEELSVTVNATPTPSETDYQDQRGVSVWDLSVPAGGQSEISIETTLRWPEGKTLSWAP